jgi:general secretion pathway protein I
MSRRTRRGFTLIEVLVALVIVAVGMSAMMGALTSSARTVVYMQDKTFAEWVALNQIANDRLQLGQGQVPAVGSSNGDLDNFAGRSWHWRQDVVASQVPGIMRIDVKVRPKEVKGGDDDNWYVTVSGLVGNGIGLAGSSEAMINWDPTPGSTNNPGTNPNSPQVPGTTNNPSNPTNGSGALPGGNSTPTPTPTPQTNPQL